MTITGSSPLICAPQTSKSCCARIGAKIPTEATAVTSEHPAFIQRRLRRSLKKRSQVSSSSADDDEGVEGVGVGGVVVVEAFRICLDICDDCCALGDCAPLDVHVVGLAAKLTIPRALCLLNEALAMMGKTARGKERRHAVAGCVQKREAMLLVLMKGKCDANGRLSSVVVVVFLLKVKVKASGGSWKWSSFPPSLGPISALPHVRLSDLTSSLSRLPSSCVIMV